MSAIGDYLRETRSELRHVAWPTRTQTIVYTALVTGVSLAIALYLGLFDFLFTTGLTQLLNVVPANSAPPVTVTQQPVTATSAPAVTGPSFTIPGQQSSGSSQSQ